MASNSKPLVRAGAGTSVASNTGHLAPAPLGSSSGINIPEPGAGASPHQTITPSCTR